MYTHNTFHNTSPIDSIQSTPSTQCIFHHFTVLHSQIRISFITECQSWLTFKGRSAKHYLNALATTMTDKDFVPLCLPPWVIPLSMAVLILEGLKNHHSADSYLMIFKFQYPPSLCTSFQNSIYFSSKRCWRTAVFDLCGFFRSVFKRTSSAPKTVSLIQYMTRF